MSNNVFQEKILFISHIKWYKNVLSRVLGVKVEVNEDILKLLTDIIAEKGKPYCPCRKPESEATICPCKWHIEELKKQGRCCCGLFYVVGNLPVKN